MKPGAELSKWLADPEKHRMAAAKWDDYSRNVADRPIFRWLRAEIDALDTPTNEDVAAIAERLLDRIDDVAEQIEELIDAAASDPYIRVPFPEVRTDINAGLLLFEHPWLQISVGVIDVDLLAAKQTVRSGPRSITFSGHPTLYRFIKGGGATFSFWEAPSLVGPDLPDRETQCRFTGRRRLVDGERLILDGRYQSFVIEHATSDIVHLQAAIRAETASVSAEYDAETLRLIGASSADEAASRVQMMVTLLRLMDRTDAGPLIAEALNSPHFHIRWYVMRELLVLDADLALPHLRRMAEADPSCEVRAAARQTLDTFFAEEPLPCPA